MYDTEVAAMPAMTQPIDWFSLLAKYGFTTFIATALLAYMAFFVVEPMRNDQQEFMKSVIRTNESHAEVAKKQTEIQMQQAKALQDIVPVLQQIRDDQRRGAWLEPKKSS